MDGQTRSSKESRRPVRPCWLTQSHTLRSAFTYQAICCLSVGVSTVCVALATETYLNVHRQCVAATGSQCSEPSLLRGQSVRKVGRQRVGRYNHFMSDSFACKDVAPTDSTNACSMRLHSHWWKVKSELASGFYTLQLPT